MIKKIAHLGDIHIFKNKRLEEHYHIIDKLYDDLIDEKVDLIYIGGDIIDSKGTSTSQQKDAVSYLFYKLSSICPIIYILGNHDFSFTNKDSQTIVEESVDSINNKNSIYCLKYSGVYTLYDIDFIVYSRVDELSEVLDNYETDRIKIGLYHGIITNKVKLFNNSLSNNETNISLEKHFLNTGNVFLNDIHLMQSFRDNDVAYSGSLIQVNISETMDRGYLIWEFDKKIKKYTFRKKTIISKYGFEVIPYNNIKEINDKVLKIKKDGIDKNKHLVFRKMDGILENKYEEQKTIKSILKDNKLENKFSIKPHKISDNKLIKTLKSIKPESNKDKNGNNYEEKIISAFLEKQYKDVSLKDIKEEDSIIKKELKEIDVKDNTIVPLNLTVNGFMKLKDKMSFDFTEYNKSIIGIIGENETGKTSFLYSISFLIWGKTPADAKKQIEYINDDVDKLDISGCFLVNNNKIYLIRRTVGRKSGGNIYLKNIDKDGNIIKDLSNGSKTQNEINNIFGEYEYFELITFSSQNKSSDLIDVKNSDRLTNVIRIMGLEKYILRSSYASKKYLSLLSEHNVKDGIYKNNKETLMPDSVIREKENLLEEKENKLNGSNGIIKKLNSNIKKISKIDLFKFKFTEEEYKEKINNLKKEIKLLKEEIKDK